MELCKHYHVNIIDDYCIFKKQTKNMPIEQNMPDFYL